MAVKNFVFRETLVVSKVVGMKTIFFVIFDSTRIHILVPTGPIKEFLKQHFSKKDKLYYQFCYFKTDLLK